MDSDEEEQIIDILIDARTDYAKAVNEHYNAVGMKDAPYISDSMYDALENNIWTLEDKLILARKKVDDYE